MNRFITLYPIYRRTGTPGFHLSVDSIESIVGRAFGGMEMGSVVTTKTGARHEVDELPEAIMFLVKHGPGGRWVIRLRDGGYFAGIVRNEALDGVVFPRVWSCLETQGATRFDTQEEAEAARLGIDASYKATIEELKP